MERRNFLVTVVGGSVALAGCSGQSDDGDSSGDGQTDPTSTPGPADVSASISAPSGVSVGDPIDIEVTASNDGGRAGEFQGTVEAIEGNLEFEETVEIEEIPGGESVTETVTTEEVQFGDTYRFALAETDADPATVDVGPQELAVGERFDIGSELMATVTDISFPPMVRYSERRDSAYGLLSSRDAVGVLSAPTERTLALVEFELENIGTESASFEREVFDVASGQFYPADIAGALERDGNPLYGRVNIDPSEVKTGFLLAQVETEALGSEGLTLEWQRDSTDTPPEKRLMYTPETVPRPDFEITRLSGPSEMSVGEEYEVTAEVRNTGETTGTFHGVFQWRYQEASSYEDPEWMDDTLANPKLPTAEIGPGESEVFTITTSSDGDGTFSYRLAPTTGKTITTTFTE